MFMAAESFFARWAKRKPQDGQEQAPPMPAPEGDANNTPAEQRTDIEAQREQQRALTMEDVARLTPESDFRPFVARGVDENIKRSALKKLFSDPHFNVMDGLDVYIDDYNKFTPIPPQMLAALNHAKGLLNPLSQSDNPLTQLLEEPDEKEKDAAPDDSKPQENAGSTTSDTPSEPIEPTLRNAADDDSIQDM
jgi:hypothetical protein